MNIDRRLRSLALGLCTLVLASLPLGARAGTIGVNFGTGAGSLAATDSAGVAPYAQTHYNNLNGAATNLVLNDNSGIATTTLLNFAAPNFGYTTPGPAGPDEVLNANTAYYFTSQSFTLSSIPYASYTLVVYDLGYANATIQSITVGGTTYYTSSPVPGLPGYADGNAATAFIYTPSFGTSQGTAAANSDYVIFTGLSGSSLTVTETLLSGATGSLGGFQLIQTVPEPSTWALLGLGGVGVLGITLRRRRQMG